VTSTSCLGCRASMHASRPGFALRLGPPKVSNVTNTPLRCDPTERLKVTTTSSVPTLPVKRGSTCWVGVVTVPGSARSPRVPTLNRLPFETPLGRAGGGLVGFSVPPAGYTPITHRLHTITHVLHTSTGLCVEGHAVDCDVASTCAVRWTSRQLS
jgi:hypothetical protein